jgi:FlaA1/EpsC-like NDP-sugar epimerase
VTEPLLPPGLDLAGFIARHVTGRATSMFAADLAAHEDAVRAELAGRSLLVIGGAGTIGGAFIRQALRYGPARLTVVDTSENGLTELTRDLRSSPDQTVPAEFLTYPIDFGSDTFARLLRASGPYDVVAHFAAHKHVRSEKDQFSIEAMVRNNVLSTVRLLDLLADPALTPRRFFTVSTDKAANPANVMGATKKLMEDAVLAYAAEGLVPATTARFANVAFSAGSLPAGFLERIAKRQPLAAPSDVRRWFISPEESGQLCLIAATLAAPGEIVFPQLGAEQMRTFDAIADALLGELGYVPERHESEEAARAAAAAGPASRGDRTWPVVYFTSDTSGEKPEEEFHTEEEAVDPSRFAALGVVRPPAVAPAVAAIREAGADLALMFERSGTTKAQLVAVLSRLVPTFHHVETGRGLDGRM